jgi:proteic killer suppression protein
MKDIFVVRLTSRAEKDLKKIPEYVVDKLNSWVDAVGHDGIIATRKISGYHDEPLKGRRNGQRSIRLNRSYRAIYAELNDGSIEFIEIQEVSNHEYKK